MPVHRQVGVEHPGWKWGPFTVRVPFYHTGVDVPEFLQGFLVAGATGLALVPLLTGQFGLTFEEAVAFIVVLTLLVCSAFIVFGDPFAPGWITPALPLVLSVVLATGEDGRQVYPGPVLKFQLMTAVSINFSLILFFMGFTGLGKKFVEWLPGTFKAGIVMGAALAAVYRVFLVEGEAFDVQPVSTLVALGTCLILMFSIPLQRYKRKHKWLALVTSLGLLPGFVAAALVGPFVGEIEYQVENGILIPPVFDLWVKASPFSIGWPAPHMFLEMLPLALMGYVILFGDLITGMEVLKSAIPSRPDEKIDINLTRSHLALGIRNLCSALVVPFFPTQGALWTGVHVIIVRRWAEGRRAMDSLFSGISSYYSFGIPVLYLLLPVVSALKPLMPIALALTLILTGFACFYVAIGIVHTRTEQGTVLLIAFAIAFFPPWQGMAMAVFATLTLVGLRSVSREDEG